MLPTVSKLINFMGFFADVSAPPTVSATHETHRAIQRDAHVLCALACALLHSIPSQDLNAPESGLSHRVRVLLADINPDAWLRYFRP